MQEKKTIYTIAEALGLSPGTISKVINQNGNVSEQTRERVVSYIKEVGYVPAKSARNLKSKRTFTIVGSSGDTKQISCNSDQFMRVLEIVREMVPVTDVSYV